jgi:hypothetical protein
MTTRRRSRRLALAGIVTAALGLTAGAQTAHIPDLRGKPAWQVMLPDELAEISGLAFSEDGRLFAHGDEFGVVYQVDPRSGRILESFSIERTGREPHLGKKANRGAGAAGLIGDFEGIAIAGSRFFLITSNGVLLEFTEPTSGRSVTATAHPTGLERLCEVEGIDYDPGRDNLLLLCKDAVGKARLTAVQIYAWSLKQRRLVPQPILTVPYEELARRTGQRAFNGSGLAVRPGGESIVLVAGPQRAFAEVDRSGRVLSAGVFPAGLHRQPEGVAFGPDGSLLVSSEAAGRKATLAAYRPAGR